MSEHGDRLLAKWRPDVPADTLDLVQEGTVSRPPGPGLSSTDRFDGFNAGSVGSGDLLLDDETRWVHFRKKRL